MRVTCFGSGSNGNAMLIQSGTTSVLIDSGIPVRLLRSLLRRAGVVDGALDAILISHEHSDHVRSATQIAKYQPVPYFGTEGTICGFGRQLSFVWERMTAGETLSIGELEIIPVDVSHDAQEPVGFCVRHGDCQVAIFTDLGEPNTDVASALAGSSLIVLESNYDELMLKIGPYPERLKRRIRGPRGHLANDVSADLIARTIDDQTADVWLAHLSDKNNRPDIARSVAAKRLQASDLRPFITTLPRYGDTAVWDSQAVALRHRQETLF